jgi:hypothetical protein
VAELSEQDVADLRLAWCEGAKTVRVTAERILAAHVELLQAVVERLRAQVLYWKGQTAQAEADLNQERRDRADTVERVTALHKTSERPTSMHYYCDPHECDQAGEGELQPQCDECGQWAPCSTVRTITAETTQPEGELHE